VHALEGVIFVELAKELDNKLFRDVVGVEEDTASISGVLVVLQGAAV
jgi:hypothetical protein